MNTAIIRITFPEGQSSANDAIAYSHTGIAFHMADFSTAKNRIDDITAVNRYHCAIDITKARIIVGIIAWLTKTTTINVTR